MGRTRLCFSVLRDFVVLTAGVAVANLFLDPHDAGWMHLNPTPWLLPAALLGVRYGFSSGLMTGLAVGALLAWAKSRMEDVAINELLHENAYYFLSVVITGGLAGEIGTILRKGTASTRETNRKLSDENARLRFQLHVTDETRHQLQQQLALFNAPMCALDEELRTLFTYPEQEFQRELLRALHRLTGLTSAAIYLVDRGVLTRAAVLHETPPLTLTLSLTQTPLAEKALASGALASVADATELTQEQPFLAAFPWLDHLGRKSVLLIQDMPFEAFTWQHLARIELIISWASAVAVLRQTFIAAADQRRSTSSADFMVLLSEAVEADRVHSLPSVVLRFDFDGAKALREALRMLPNTAVITRLTNNHSLAVLLPFSGETEALQTRRNLATALPATTSRHLLITGEVSSASLWEALQNP
jgi:hypothetical protein